MACNTATCQSGGCYKDSDAEQQHPVTEQNPSTNGVAPSGDNNHHPSNLCLKCKTNKSIAATTSAAAAAAGDGGRFCVDCFRGNLFGKFRVALQFVHEIQHKAQKNFDASASRDRSLPVFGVGAAFIDESAICPVSSNEFDEALEEMRLIVTNLAPPRKKFHVVPMESVYSSDCCNGRDRLKELLNAVSDVTGREDLLVHLRMLCLQKIALENGYTKLVFGSCTSRIACHILAATVKVVKELPQHSTVGLRLFVSSCINQGGQFLRIFVLLRRIPLHLYARGEQCGGTVELDATIWRNGLCWAQVRYEECQYHSKLKDWEESTGSPLAWFMPNESPALEEGKMAERWDSISVGDAQLCRLWLLLLFFEACSGGRGYSLAADIQYVDARWEIPVVLPLRDCLMQELNVLCMLDSLKTVEVFNGSRVGINGLVTSFVKLLQEENPSRECTIARTAGKLTPFHFNKIPEADDCNDHLAIQRRQKKFNLKPDESLPPESFCPICSSPLNNSFTSVSGCENGHRSPEDFIATCCTSCQFQILPSEPSALGHFCSILPQQIVDQAKDGSCGNQRWLREQIKDCLLSDSEDGT
ncbi:hypothetical protein RJ640_010804 [Escallonia rubra]|uniref:Cytoplasmic tRNA 2-thiolation protein 2 n=1 Tax=Escallonia rubra TaxID=112253 RepID=A0AA88S963_9ASTE|nr:hypothetical protein RJ640_010804 [Escallonia rubra]